MCLCYFRSGSEKDELRRTHELLCYECGNAHCRYKTLRGVIEQLSREYEDSKEVDYFRRYRLLKGMIKRSILYLKLRENDDSNQSQATSGGQKEEMRKREEQLAGTGFDLGTSVVTWVI